MSERERLSEENTKDQGKEWPITFQKRIGKELIDLPVRMDRWAIARQNQEAGK